MFFQNSILKKYLAMLNDEQVKAAWEQYQALFLNQTRQDNILTSKEEQYQEGFLRELFVKTLGYTINPDPDFNLITEKKNETDSKKADGAIQRDGKVIGIIELKDHKTPDLKQVETQAFGYKNRHRGTRYVVISNFEKLRFYIDDATEYMEWDLFSLKEEDFRELFFCLSWDTLSQDLPIKAKTESVSSEDQITQQLYRDYSAFKRELFADILKNNTTDETPKEQILLLFKKTQKLLDRLLFIFFAEDSGLLPPNSMVLILDDWQKLKDMDEYRPLYSRIRKYFGYLDTGFQGKHYEIFAYNGGLFKPDEVLDSITISDEVLAAHCRRLSDYNYASEVDVNILGHIFENSLNEIEEVTAQINRSASVPLAKNEDASNSRERDAHAPGKRKRDGVFYTPQYITKYIVENTVGRLCAEKKAELGVTGSASVPLAKKADKQARLAVLERYREWLKGITICDPACGSGAFLNAALRFLMDEHKLLDEMEAKVAGASIVFQNVENAILENNLFGVDINEESVEIAKLALWLRTAKPHRKLSSLNDNIKCGNSLINDPEIAREKAFNWQAEFPDVFKSASVPLATNMSTVMSDQRERDAHAPVKPWHSRHYVPHIEDKKFQFVTFRLYDSMPKDIIDKWKEELKITDEEKTPVPILTRLLERINKFEDTGYGQCFLRDERIAKLVEDALLRFDGQQYRLLRWCIMPNHVHVLIEVLPNNSLTAIMHSWRSYTAHEANKILERTGEFWQKEYFDRYIRNAQHFRDTVDYIDNNPVNAGLVATPEDWQWCTRSASVPLATSETTNTNDLRKRDACAPEDQRERDAHAPEDLRKRDACAPGFDIVIGNPPYVNMVNILDENQRKYYQKNYKTVKNKSDLYSIFTEKSAQLLKPNGKFGFIFSNSWMGTESFSTFREFLAHDVKVTKLVELPPGVFSDATVTTVLCFYENTKPKETDIIEIETYKDGQFIPKGFFLPYKQVLENPNTSFSFEKTIELNKVPTIELGDIVSFSLGIKTSDDKRFVFEEKKDDDCHLFLRGRNIKRWNTPENNEWLWYKPELICEKPGGRPRIFENFVVDKKIVIQDIAAEIIATLDCNKYLCNDTLNIIFDIDRKYDFEYILVLLNSKLVNTWFKKVYPAGLHIKTNQLETIPIPVISAADQQPFIDHADRMLSLNKDLQEKRARFLRRLQDNIRSASVTLAANTDNNRERDAHAPVRITAAFETFETLDFAGFVAELKKQKIQLSLVQQDEWEDYFTRYKSDCNALTATIAETDKEIDALVYALYGLTDDEIKLIEQ
ncbi:MAG: N-6 DNA methylase [Paludibacteraceae bacterium]|nr:N-6 DNA methylase [Paludibacteraceae bacterium]